MKEGSHTISVKGKVIEVPSIQIGSARVVTTGRFVRTAAIHDEEWLEQEAIGDTSAVLESLRAGSLKADIFSFSQRIPDVQPRFPYSFEWDNAAVVPITTYKSWWDELSQESRRNIRLAGKRGIEVRVAAFDDDFVRGIMAIYNEAPVRLGKPFWHYGKDIETVRRENGTYLERSEFIGAWFEGKLIGFVKLVYVDKIGSIMQILSMIEHQSKRTTNALIAKAVEVCEARAMSYLRYCSYVYGVNESSLLTEFKRRNGFVRMDFPRYYVPLTPIGKIAIKLRAQHGVKGMLPPEVLNFALQLRSKYYNLRKQGRAVPVE